MNHSMLRKSYRFALGFLTPYVLVAVVSLDHKKYMEGSDAWVCASFFFVPVLWLLWRMARSSYKTASFALFWTAFVLMTTPTFRWSLGQVLGNWGLLALGFGLVFAFADARNHRREHAQMARRIRERYHRQTVEN